MDFNTRQKRAGRFSAYSLLEMVLVTTIISILATLAVVHYGQVIEKGRAAEAYSILSDIVGAEKAYYAENSAYTNVIASLHSFTAAPNTTNFNFSVPSVDANSGYAQATRTSGAAGRQSYYMCLSSGKRGVVSGGIGCP